MSQVFGSYELLSPLATGGTAEVSLARMTGSDALVVVKQLLPHLAEDKDFVAMFLDEARLGSQLTHGNIARTLDQGMAQGRAFLAMEYVAGMTVGKLAAGARKRGGLPAPLAVAIVRDACAGLHHAHEARLPDGTALSIVHRDVSPQNIIVTFGGEVKIVDFGIAHAAIREARTKTGMVKGKFAYMSPEQCVGGKVDRRTDVFAAGVVLWELLAGRRLFKRPTSYETYQAILRGDVPATGADPALDAIVRRALARECEARQATAAELAADLDGWLRARGLSVGPADLARLYQQRFAAELEQHRVWLARVRAGKSTGPPAVESWSEEPPSDTEAPLPAGQRAAALSGPDEATTYRASPEERTALEPVPLPSVPEAQPFLVVPVEKGPAWKLWLVVGLSAAGVALIVVLSRAC